MRNFSVYVKIGLSGACLALLWGWRFSPGSTDDHTETSETEEMLWVDNVKCGPPPPPPPLMLTPPRTLNNDSIYQFVWRMPLFPGCEDLGEYWDQKQCADQKLLDFIRDNQSIPPLALLSSVSGTVIVGFVVEKDGSVSNVDVVRDIGIGYGNAVVNAVRRINEKGIRFTPGGDRGRKVRVRYEVPISINVR